MEYFFKIRFDKVYMLLPDFLVLLRSRNFVSQRMNLISFPETVAWRCSVKEVFLKILQNSLENTCARVSLLIKLQANVCNFVKKETLVQVFSCEFCEFLRALFFINPLVPGVH